MGFPVGVAVVTVESGRFQSFTGHGVTVEATLTPVIPRVGGGRISHLVWSDGTVYPARREVVPVVDGVLRFQVPATDQPGWRDPSGADYTGWFYRVEVRAGVTRTGRPEVWVKEFSPLVSQAPVLDLDSVPDAQVAEPVAVFQPVDLTPYATTTYVTEAVAAAATSVVEVEPGVYEIGAA